MGYEPSFQDPLSLLPILGGVFVLGLVWLAVRFIFKIALKVFAAGCVGIVFVAAVLFLSGRMLPTEIAGICR